MAWPEKTAARRFFGRKNGRFRDLFGRKKIAFGDRFLHRLEALLSREAVDVFANGAVGFDELWLRDDSRNHRVPW